MLTEKGGRASPAVPTTWFVLLFFFVCSVLINCRKKKKRASHTVDLKSVKNDVLKGCGAYFSAELAAERLAGCWARNQRVTKTNGVKRSKRLIAVTCEGRGETLTRRLCHARAANVNNRNLSPSLACQV